MDAADPTDAPPPPGASARLAWTVAAVLAVALVGFAYVVGARSSPPRAEPARLAESRGAPPPEVIPPPIESDRPPGGPRDTDAESIDRALVAKMREDAKVFCALSSTTPRQGLAKYGVVEDYVRKAVEDAKKTYDKEREAAYTAIYKGLLEDSDAYTARVVTPTFIESIPWKDLLSAEMAGKWSRVTNVPGFSSRVANGVLTVTPPDAGTRLQGVVGILDQPTDNLRHFVLDMEFAVEGCATTYFHVSPPPGSPDEFQSFAYGLAACAGGLTPGAKYTLAASYIGSDVDVKVSGDTDNSPWCGSGPSWAKRRRGGIAFLIPEGARLTITRMRIKELR